MRVTSVSESTGVAYHSESSRKLVTSIGSWHGLVDIGFGGCWCFSVWWCGYSCIPGLSRALRSCPNDFPGNLIGVAWFGYRISSNKRPPKISDFKINAPLE